MGGDYATRSIEALRPDGTYQVLYRGIDAGRAMGLARDAFRSGPWTEVIVRNERTGFTCDSIRFEPTEACRRKIAAWCGEGK